MVGHYSTRGRSLRKGYINLVKQILTFTEVEMQKIREYCGLNTPSTSSYPPSSSAYLLLPLLPFPFPFLFLPFSSFAWRSSPCTRFSRATALSGDFKYFCHNSQAREWKFLTGQIKSRNSSLAVSSFYSLLLSRLKRAYSLIPMANPSLDKNSISTSDSNPLKDNEGEESIILKSRPSFIDVPNIEEVDSKYRDIILTLPKEERWLAFPIRKYKDFWQQEQFIPGIMAMEETFKPCPDDVIVASFIKSGTTWLKALTFTIMHRNKYAFSSHPLLKLNPHDCVPITEFHYAVRDEHYLETLPSPRVLGTHLAYSILPESIKTSKCPIVYICREPKDVIVSYWHMVTRFAGFEKSFPFTQALELFCEGRIIYGPVWDHVREYYMKSLHYPEKILFLKYEEMMEAPVDGVMRLANFIGCPFSEEEIKTGLVKEIVEFCSFNKLKDLDVNKKGTGIVQNDYFFRKAVVGDWQNHMAPEMAITVDRIIKEKLNISGFTY